MPIMGIELRVVYLCKTISTFVQENSVCANLNDYLSTIWSATYHYSVDRIYLVEKPKELINEYSFKRTNTRSIISNEYSVYSFQPYENYSVG